MKQMILSLHLTSNLYFTSFSYVFVQKDFQKISNSWRVLQKEPKFFQWEHEFPFDHSHQQPQSTFKFPQFVQPCPPNPPTPQFPFPSSSQPPSWPLETCPPIPPQFPYTFPRPFWQPYPTFPQYPSFSLQLCYRSISPALANSPSSHTKVQSQSSDGIFYARTVFHCESLPSTLGRMRLCIQCISIDFHKQGHNVGNIIFILFLYLYSWSFVMEVTCSIKAKFTTLILIHFLTCWYTQLMKILLSVELAHRNSFVLYP